MSGPTDPAEAHFDKGLWGFDGTAWRKLQLLFGYGAGYYERVEVSDAGAGNYTVVGSTVPDDEVWVVNSAMMFASVAAASVCEIHVGIAAARYYLSLTGSLAALSVLQYQGFVVLAPGYHIGAYWEALAASNVKYLTIVGFKMGLNL